MKNIKFALFTLFACLSSWAVGQAPTTVYTNPAAFSVEKEVTLFVDLAGTALVAETGPFYVWSWSAGGDNAVQGDWDPISEDVKMTQVDGTLWSVTFTPNVWFPAGIAEGFNFLIRNQAGDKKTDNVEGNASTIPFDFSVMDSEKAMIWPAKFTANTPISLIINVRNAVKDGSKNIPDEGPVNMHSGAILGENIWQNVVGADAANSGMEKVNNEGVWVKNMIPAEYYSLAAADQAIFKGISMVANKGGDWAYEFKDGDKDFFLKTLEDEVEKPSDIRSFPTQVTANDLVVVYFNANEPVNKETKLAIESKVFVTFFINEEETTKQRVEMIPLYNGLYKAAIIPSQVFAGEDITKLEYVYANEAGDVFVKKYLEKKEEYVNYEIEIVK